MLAHIRGKGLVIFTGCSHAGVINICRHAQELFSRNTTVRAGRRPPFGIPERRSHRRDYRRIEEVPFKRDYTRAGGRSNAFVRAFGEKTVDPLAVGTRQSL
jgi:7,8-dihydropterin-6-yl-methyl-4-(beta-D-ribofuranosyl)aminobenzene 5'-phosphate synthase